MKVDNFVLLIISIVTLIIISLLTECNRGRLTELENKATKEIVETFFHKRLQTGDGLGEWGYQITGITEGKYGGRSRQQVINKLLEVGSHSEGDYIDETEKEAYGSGLFNLTSDVKICPEAQGNYITNTGKFKLVFERLYIPREELELESNIDSWLYLIDPIYICQEQDETCQDIAAHYQDNASDWANFVFGPDATNIKLKSYIEGLYIYIYRHDFSSEKIKCKGPLMSDFKNKWVNAEVGMSSNIQNKPFDWDSYHIKSDGDYYSFRLADNSVFNTTYLDEIIWANWRHTGWGKNFSKFIDMEDSELRTYIMRNSDNIEVPMSQNLVDIGIVDVIELIDTSSSPTEQQVKSRDQYRNLTYNESIISVKASTMEIVFERIFISKDNINCLDSSTEIIHNDKINTYLKGDLLGRYGRNIPGPGTSLWSDHVRKLKNIYDGLYVYKYRPDLSYIIENTNEDIINSNDFGNLFNFDFQSNNVNKDSNWIQLLQNTWSTARRDDYRNFDHFIGMSQDYLPLKINIHSKISPSYYNKNLIELGIVKIVEEDTTGVNDITNSDLIYKKIYRNNDDDSTSTYNACEDECRQPGVCIYHE